MYYTNKYSKIFVFAISLITGIYKVKILHSIDNSVTQMKIRLIANYFRPMMNILCLVNNSVTQMNIRLNTPRIYF